MYTGTGDGRWDPENGLYGNGIIGVKQNPETKSLDLVDYYGPSNAEWLVKRDLDMQVTPVIFLKLPDAEGPYEVDLTIHDDVATTTLEVAEPFTVVRP